VAAMPTREAYRIRPRKCREIPFAGVAESELEADLGLHRSHRLRAGGGAEARVLWLEARLYEVARRSSGHSISRRRTVFGLDTTTMADGSHTLQARAYDLDGRRTSVSRTVTISNGASGSDIVQYASEAPVRPGSWRVVADKTAAGGRRLEQPQAGAATIEPPREDGVSIDQVVLSPATYLTRAPGALKNDTTILPKQ
jgi:hypothetical protein